MNIQNHRAISFTCLLFFVVAAFFTPACGAEEVGSRLNFQNLSVFSAGIHKFEQDHLHPGRQAVVIQDLNLIKVLMREGVAADRIVALRDEEANTANCKLQLKNLLAKTKAGDSLLLFIHSHGSLGKGGLICTYETGGIWSFEDLIKEVEENFKGDTACICIAACHSGSLLDVIKSAPRRISYFTVTSVSRSLNAKTVATADFEACIKDAFGGAPCPDLNQDGLITFDEFGRYVSDDQVRLFHTEPEYGATGRFDRQMVINSSRPREGAYDCQLVQLASGVRGRVIRQDGNRILVRGSKNPNVVQWVNANAVTPIP